jgi:hypothetical protein
MGLSKMMAKCTLPHSRPYIRRQKVKEMDECGTPLGYIIAGICFWLFPIFLIVVLTRWIYCRLAKKEFWG